MDEWDGPPSEHQRGIGKVKAAAGEGDAPLRFERREYGERRFMTAGWLRGRFVIVEWTRRGRRRRIISMRYGHAEEEAYWRAQME